MTDQQVAGPELALDEHEIAGRGLLVEPGETGRIQGAAAPRPAARSLQRRLSSAGRHLGHAQFEPGPGQLPGE